MTVRIYRPARTAMQSGKQGTRNWVLEHVPETARRPEPLMGWVAAGDTRRQVRLRFETREEAIAYAERNNLVYEIREPRTAVSKPKAYADNFAFDRLDAWTH